MSPNVFRRLDCANGIVGLNRICKSGLADLGEAVLGVHGAQIVIVLRLLLGGRLISKLNLFFLLLVVPLVPFGGPNISFSLVLIPILIPSSLTNALASALS